MYEFLTSVIAVAVVLGIMIVVHEFGHFAAAKFFGVYVETFSVGFGPRLFGFRKGETDYRVSAIPLGGYVKMKGENPMEARTGDSREFMAHPRWQRFIIAFAGPLMNIVLAIALLTGVYMVRYEHPVYLDQPAVIGWVLENSPAAKAGIQPGDRIAKIDGLTNPTWEDVLPKVVLSPNEPIKVTIERGSEQMEKIITPTTVGPEQFGSIGWLPDQPNTVTEIEKDMPAARAGIREGDIIVALDGQGMRSMSAVFRYFQESKDKAVTMTVVRDGHEVNLTVTPRFVTNRGLQQWRIGVGSDPQHVDRLPFTKAVAKSLDQNKKNSFLILELVEKMLQRKISMKQIEGPIGIARASGQAARQQGWTPLLALMAAISLNLGIFNLFPIPILDGGVILLLLIESVRRRDISIEVKELVYKFAFVLLVLFAVMVIYNDLSKLIPQRLP